MGLGLVKKQIFSLITASTSNTGIPSDIDFPRMSLGCLRVSFFPSKSWLPTFICQTPFPSFRVQIAESGRLEIIGVGPLAWVFANSGNVSP